MSIEFKEAQTEQPDGSLHKVDFFSSTTAPTLDDIAAAVKSTSALVASDNVRSLFEKSFKMVKDFPCEQFNFGKLPHRVILEAQRDAIDFVKHGLFKPPYPVCLYRCNVDYGSVVIGTSLLVVEPDAIKKDQYGVATVSMVHSKDHLIAQHSINLLKVGDPPPGVDIVGRPTVDGEQAVMLEIPREEASFWEQTLLNSTGQRPSLHDMCDGSMMMMGLTMILNTKGVFKDRTAPPRKPNENRAKTGKLLLPYVTHVHTQAYARSTTNHEEAKGTHASPRPHRRRAHVRHYPERDGRAAYVLPIEAMLVNWDGTPLTRGQYKVD